MKSTRWLLLLALLFVAGASLAEKKKSYTSGHFMLSLDGEPAVVKSIDGGGVKKTADKSAVTLRVDRASKSIWQWVSATLSQGAVPKRIEMEAAGKRHVTMTGCLIKEVSFPKLDAKDGKKHLDIEVVFEPEAVSESKDKKDLKGNVDVKQKAFLPSNFRVQIGDLPTAKVKKVDALTFKMKTLGKQREVVIPSIRLTLDSADAPAWQAALKAKTKKSGSIALTDADGSTWAKLDLAGVRVTSVKSAADGSVVTLNADKVSLH